MVRVLKNKVEVAAKEALGKSPIYSLRQLNVSQIDDSILISGHVDSFYHKQLAQELVRVVSCGCRVVNSVDVASDS